MKYTRRTVYRHLKESISFPKGLMLLCGIVTMVITVVSLIQPYLYKILVDDVMTTGATFSELRRVLMRAGASAVYGVTFCRVVRAI